MFSLSFIATALPISSSFAPSLNSISIARLFLLHKVSNFIAVRLIRTSINRGLMSIFPPHEQGITRQQNYTGIQLCLRGTPQSAANYTNSQSFIIGYHTSIPHRAYNSQTSGRCLLHTQP